METGRDTDRHRKRERDREIEIEIERDRERWSNWLFVLRLSPAPAR